jgi:hypothetical protein
MNNVGSIPSYAAIVKWVKCNLSGLKVELKNVLAKILGTFLP